MHLIGVSVLSISAGLHRATLPATLSLSEFPQLENDECIPTDFLKSLGNETQCAEKVVRGTGFYSLLGLCLQRNRSPLQAFLEAELVMLSGLVTHFNSIVRAL